MYICRPIELKEAYFAAFFYTETLIILYTRFSWDLYHRPIV